MTDGGDPTALLEIDALTVRRHHEALLDDVTLRVRRGSIHVLVGPNGAGKSTLLSAILGQIPFDGRIAVNWRGAGTIGYVPQSFAVDPTLPVTVADFLALTRQRRPVCLGLTRAARLAIARLLERVGLPGLEQRPLAVLSGGELRRVLLAHALDPEPELLLLDEPTAGLDESAVQILDEILIAIETDRADHGGDGVPRSRAGATCGRSSHGARPASRGRGFRGHPRDGGRARVAAGCPRTADRTRMTSFYAWIGGLAQRGLLPSDFQYPFLVRGFLCVLVLAPILGGVSHLVVTRRMAFFSAALGQAAITGVALGLLLGEPLNAPYGGMFGFCLLSTLAMVYVKRHATLPPDTLIGVFHALTLGLGLCLLVALTRQFNVHQVESVLFGSLLTVTDGDLALLLAVGIVVAVLLVREYNHLLLDSLSPPLASVAGAEPAYLEYFFALLLTLSIVVSLKIIGALLVEALVVVPAAAARNVARGTRSYLIWSVAVAFLAGIGGLGVSTRFLVPTGGAVVLAVSAIFFLTLAARSVLRRTLV